MSLEHELRALGVEMGWPESPDVAAAVRSRIETPRRARRPLMARRAVVVALAALVAAGTALAVPPARSAIFRALGIGAVRIDLVDELPAVAPRSDLALLGEPVTVAKARERFPHSLLEPDTDELSPPDEVRFRAEPVMVSYLWSEADGPRLLVSQLEGQPASGFVKLVGPDTTAEDLAVDGRRAVWIEGDAHGFGLAGSATAGFEEMRLAANTLLVEVGPTTLRIEGELTRERAIRVARAFVR